MGGVRGNGSLPVPRPKSPPAYPDLYGKRRESAKVQVLEREIGFLEEELKSIEGLRPASRSCKELLDFVTANPDPLIPTTKKTRRKPRGFWKWLSCFNMSWICCCSCSNLPCTCCSSSNCCQCTGNSCCNSCSKPACPNCCELPKCDCDCCDCFSCGNCECFSKCQCCRNCCSGGGCRNCCSGGGCDCCRIPRPKCPSCSGSCSCTRSCCCCTCCCCYPKCPKFNVCSGCHNNACCYPCYFCY